MVSVVDVSRVFENPGSSAMQACLPTMPRKSKSIQFELRAPDAEAVCPITQDLISASSLDFLQDCSYDAERPELRAVRLRCGHDFSAMNIVYHWARNKNVLCPVCRGGPRGAWLDMKGLPAHFQKEMCRKVTAERRKDMRDERRDHHMAAVQIQMQPPPVEPVFMSDNTSIAVVRRYAVVGQSELNHGFRMPCAALGQGEWMLFSCRMPAPVLWEMGEFKVFGLLLSGSEVEPIHWAETRFPESDWLTYTSSTERLWADTDGIGPCRYQIVTNEDRSVTIKCFIKTNLYLLLLENQEFWNGPSVRLLP